jgi:hypothetical protein
MNSFRCPFPLDLFVVMWTGYEDEPMTKNNLETK